MSELKPIQRRKTLEIFRISGVDGMEVDSIEDTAKDHGLYFETFHIGNGWYDVEIYEPTNEFKLDLHEEGIL